MRSLFGDLAVMLMLFFNYIEISSGMSLEEKQPKTLQLFSEKPESLGRKSEENPAHRMKMNYQGKLQLFNERTERPVDADRFRKAKTKFDLRLQDLPRLDAVPKKPWSMRPNAKGVMELFDDNTGRIVGEQEQYKYQQNRKRYNKQVYPSVQKNYANFDNHHAQANRGESEYADTASSKPRSEALVSYHSYNEHNGVTPKLPRTAGHKANLLNQKEYLPYIDTPRPRKPPAAGHVPYLLNQGQHTQYSETLRPEQLGQFYGPFAHRSYYTGPSGSSESNNRH